jgi:3-oxoacyl-[acyl-carrier protein] reductase
VTETQVIDALDLTGRLALVTGSSRGIGAATVHRLVQHGATVACCGRDVSSLDQLQQQLAGEPGKVMPFVADLSDVTAADTLFDAVQGGLGQPDILVNNIGHSQPRNFLRMTNDDWESLFRLNLGSSLQLTRRALPHMVEQRWGRVVMIGSMSAKFPELDIIDYGASKAAMASVATSLARKYGQDNVLTNTVLPGFILTDAWTTSASRMAKFGIRGSEPADVLKSFADEIPLRRFANPDEIASVVLFLCSELATYVNGAAIDVDGGSSRHMY